MSETIYNAMTPALLLVDDNPHNLIALEALLEPLNVKLLKASSGEEALQLILDNEFAIVLLDIQMPEMDGFEVAELMKKIEKTRHTSIIFITAIFKDNNYVFRGFDAGGVDFISKPIEDHILLAKVRVFLSLYMKQKKLEQEIERRKETLAQLQYTLSSLRAANDEINELNTNLEQKVRQQTQELVGAKEEAEAANEFKSQFLASMSHDLRTPLHVIIGTNDILLKKEVISSQDDLRKPIEIMQQSSERLLNLVNDILDVTKLESGKMTVSPEAMTLGALLNGVEVMMSTLLNHKPVKFVQDCKIGHTIRFVSDKARLIQIITNLLGNAAKFTEEGEIRLHIFINENSQLVFEVIDTGVGLKQEDASRVFESFNQVESDLNKKHKGTGLGLAICQGLVTLLNGAINVKSTFGKGSTFQFWIPFIAAGQDHSPQEKTPVITEKPISQARVLLCDDDAFNLAFAEMALNGKAQYTLVNSGPKVLEALVADSFDIIFLDIQMPEMDGKTTLSNIRTQFPALGTPIVALTAQAMKGDRDELIALGFDDYLAKPFKQEDLLTMIKKKQEPWRNAV